MIDIHPVGDLATLLRGMRPELQPGRYAFVPAPPGLAIDPAHVVASVREREGISLVVPEQVALDMGLLVEFVSAWITLGAVVAALLWLLGSAALSFYLSHFADYNATYGSLGAAIGLMMWMWLSAVVVLLGAQLDSVIERHRAQGIGAASVVG